MVKQYYVVGVIFSRPDHTFGQRMSSLLSSSKQEASRFVLEELKADEGEDIVVQNTLVMHLPDAKLLGALALIEESKL
jgi:hypothetical protein